MRRSRDIVAATLLALALAAAPPVSAAPIFTGGARAFSGAATDVALGDFNEDGLADVISCQEGPSVSLMFGDGRGGLTFATTVPVGAGARSIVAGLFNGDGHLDFATANSGAGTVSVRYGRGDGTFDAVPDVNAGASPWAIAAADMDLDGDLDIVLVDQGGNALRTMVNLGGSFPNVTFSIGTGYFPLSIAIGTLDGGLVPDVAVGTRGDFFNNGRGVYIYRGNGNGSFTFFGKAYTYQADALAIADLDLDGKNDLLIDGGVNFGNGDLTFEPATPGLIAVNEDVTVADVDGNGIPDLLSLNSYSGLHVTRGLGARSFAEPETFSVGCEPSAVTTGDLNGDGRPDAVLASGNAVLTLLNVNHALGNVLRDAAPIAGAAAADLNSDGRDDVAWINDREAVVRLSLGAGRFGGPIATEVGADPNHVALGDLDGDDVPDLIVTHTGAASPVSVFRGLGDGTFEPVPNGHTVASPSDLATADLNGDGRLDVVVARNGGIVVLVGAGDGTFAAVRDIVVEAGPGKPQRVGIGDWNGDGRPDLVTVSYGVPTEIRTWRNSGNGLDYTGALVYSGTDIAYAADVGVGHYTSGDHLDFVTADRGYRSSTCTPGSPVFVFKGNGDGTFVMRPPVSFEGRLRATGIADLDQDGKNDLLAVSETDGVAVAADGSVSLGKRRTFGVSSAAGHAMADFDADGAPDLAVWGEGGVTILMNATHQTVAVPEPPGRALRLGAPFPSPARSLARIPFSLPAAARARVRILDAQGRLLRTLLDGRLPEGAHTLHWDLATGSGRRVAPGVYFCALDVDGVRESRRLVVIE